MMPIKRIGIFVDVQNIYYTTRDAYQRQFDYRRLWQILAGTGEIVVACAYATDRGDAGQQKFQSALKHIGFEVKLKPFLQRRDGSAKGDWDVGITIDVLDRAAELDNVVLLSGDGDFDLLLEKVRNDYGVTVDVFGVPGLTANALIQAADRYHPIDEALLI
jgi:uncharacterized LabA/DUF88 family protein